MRIGIGKSRWNSPPAGILSAYSLAVRLPAARKGAAEGLIKISNGAHLFIGSVGGGGQIIQPLPAALMDARQDITNALTVAAEVASSRGYRKIRYLGPVGIALFVVIGYDLP